MAIVGTIALIVLIVLGVMVLRVKSDPTENESVRKHLPDLKRTDGGPPPSAAQAADPAAPIDKVGT